MLALYLRPCLNGSKHCDVHIRLSGLFGVRPRSLQLMCSSSLHSLEILRQHLIRRGSGSTWETHTHTHISVLIQRRKSVHYHHRNKIFWRTFLASKKTFQAGGGYKSLMKTKKTICTTDIFLLWPPFFSAKKVLHWSRAVYVFFSQ